MDQECSSCNGVTDKIECYSKCDGYEKRQTNRLHKDSDRVRRVV